MKLLRGIVVSLMGLGVLSALTHSKDPLAESMERGKELYNDNCINCHMANGEGVQGVFPPLAKSDYLRDSTERSIRAVKYGLQGTIKVNGVAYNGIMPSAGLDDDEVADVMNFILNSWGNSSDTLITPERVKLVKEE